MAGGAKQTPAQPRIIAASVAIVNYLTGAAGVIIVGIGANLPGPDGASPLATCRAAAVRLDALAGLRLAALSRWFVTAPVPRSDQPDYVNAVGILRVEAGAGEPEPAWLLGELQRIEATAGRVRGERNAPRALDLDIIAMGEGGGMVRSAPDPVLPHPRAHLRAFVLVPLAEVAPDWVHPVLRRRALELLAGVLAQEVRALSVRM